VGVEVAAGVARVEQGLEALAVVGAGRGGLQAPEELVRAADTDREVVAAVALAVGLGRGGVQVVLTAFGRLPLAGHGTLFHDLLLFPSEVLTGSALPASHPRSAHPGRYSPCVRFGASPPRTGLAPLPVRCGFRTARSWCDPEPCASAPAHRSA